MKKSLILVLLVLNGAFCFSLEFSVRPRGFMLIPAGEQAEYYGLGGGGNIGFDFDISSLLSNPWGLGYTAGIEGGYTNTILAEEINGNLQLFSFGGGLSLYWLPLSRLFLRGEGAFGVYGGSAPDSSSSSYWYRGGLETGFRFTPNFILSANGGWGHFNNKYGGTLHSGLYLGLGAQINFETQRAGARAQAIEAALTQDEPAYPLFFSLYQNNSAGRLSIRNRESAEIRDLRVSFRAGNYTSSEFVCGTVTMIARGRSAELPFYADFSPELLNFTEKGRIAGEVVIRYQLLGQEREAVLPAAVQVYNRNTFAGSGTEADPAALAAFVSPTSPEILEYSKHITGMARTRERTGLNRRMLFAIWLFEGLREGTGIRSEANAFFEAQFPSQTLAYKSGTATDLGLLYAAALEAAGIPAAFIPPRDSGNTRGPEAFSSEDFVTAIGLGINEAGAATLFNGTEKILIVDDEVWLPLSMKEIGDGFMAAWDAAGKKMDDLFASGGEAEFIVLQNAWSSYPPAPFPALGVRIAPPDMAAVSGGVARALDQYITREINPLIQGVQRQIQGGAPAAGLSTAALYNRLGILQTRSGRTADAKASYERAAGMGSVPAMTNRGNMALNENDRAVAERWFRQALQAQPDNAAALRGLEQIEGK